MSTDIQTCPRSVPSERFIISAPRGPARPLAALLVGSALVAGASGPIYASGLDANRLSGGTALVVSREREECFRLADIMAELKLKTGLTWDQLGSLFAVSRKTIHNWAKGSEIKPDHRAKVEQLVDRVRGLTDLRPFEIRRKLLGSKGDVAVASRAEPPILFADRNLDKSRAKLRKGTSLRVVRRDGASG
jgi:hypothetical protein